MLIDWSMADAGIEAKLAELKLTVRCMPFNQSGTRAFVSYQNQNMLFSVSNLQISNFTEYAFVLDDQTNVQDLTPTVHQVTNVESVCLADPSVAGVITLNDASTCGEND